MFRYVIHCKEVVLINIAQSKNRIKQIVRLKQLGLYSNRFIYFIIYRYIDYNISRRRFYLNNIKNLNLFEHFDGFDG